tara:strand:- start:657 stop:1403 length:747 start_codon:yes stop_codon:yes gene_type:complete
MDSLQSPLVLNILKLAVIVTAVFIVMALIAYFIKRAIKMKNNRPWLIKGSKNAKNSQVISQDPKNENSITLYRSDNESGGSVFSYSFWFVIENMEYKFGEWKHIFHKGNKTSNPNRAPGVWIHPDKNALRVYMNTMKNYLEHVDIDNIPIKRWVCCVVVLNGEYLDIYINGHLKKRKHLEGVPKQNFGDLWVNLYGGYDGYLADLRYYRKALDYSEIEEIVKQGPSKEPSLDSHKYPPYLDDNWWFDI